MLKVKFCMKPIKYDSKQAEEDFQEEIDKYYEEKSEEAFSTMQRLVPAEKADNIKKTPEGIEIKNIKEMIVYDRGDIKGTVRPTWFITKARCVLNEPKERTKKSKCFLTKAVVRNIKQ